jgi:hypothetical protein
MLWTTGSDVDNSAHPRSRRAESAAWPTSLAQAAGAVLDELLDELVELLDDSVLLLELLELLEEDSLLADSLLADSPTTPPPPDLLSVR